MNFIISIWERGHARSIATHRTVVIGILKMETNTNAVTGSMQQANIINMCFLLMSQLLLKGGYRIYRLSFSIFVVNSSSGRGGGPGTTFSAISKGPLLHGVEEWLGAGRQ